MASIVVANSCPSGGRVVLPPKFVPLKVEISTLIIVIRKTPTMLKLENLFAAFTSLFLRRL